MRPRVATICVWAEKIEANDDATEYIVTLRKDVKFHNGESMTADDVVFSYDLAQASPKQASYVRPLDHVEKVDEHTVKIVMNQSFSPIGHMLHKVKDPVSEGSYRAGRQLW